MMVITGAAGFIGSCLAGRLNHDNFRYLVGVDDFGNTAQEANLVGKELWHRIHRDALFDWLAQHHREVEFVFHLGACTDSEKYGIDAFNRLNLQYSQQVWKACCEYQLPLIYASSSATYGDGARGYDDREDALHQLSPSDVYGNSKHAFDMWALQQQEKPFFWAGLKLFDVYGPNEYHKGKQASAVLRLYEHIAHSKPWAGNGSYYGDFVYVKDVVEVMVFLMRHRRNSGIYNLGTGKTRSLADLAGMLAEVLGKSVPEPAEPQASKRPKAAKMDKLRRIGYSRHFHSLEEGIADYVHGYLTEKRYY